MTHDAELSDTSERAISRMLLEFGEKLKAGDVSDLWVPTHMAIDGELDDTLAWLLLDKVRGQRREGCEARATWRGLRDERGWRAWRGACGVMSGG